MCIEADVLLAVSVRVLGSENGVAVAENMFAYHEVFVCECVCVCVLECVPVCVHLWTGIGRLTVGHRDFDRDSFRKVIFSFGQICFSGIRCLYIYVPCMYVYACTHAYIPLLQQLFAKLIHEWVCPRLKISEEELLPVFKLVGEFGEWLSRLFSDQG